MGKPQRAMGGRGPESGSKGSGGSNLHEGRETLLLAEAQVLLAEKRTSLSAVRTGIAVVALPLSIVSVLIATSKLYAWSEVEHLIWPVLLACALLFVLGTYLIVRALLRIRRFDRKLTRLSRDNSTLSGLVD
ncbi:hypothetical protein [Engelhardtia mirabilis]|uniref:Uncharacterized protein n=1 Tax=Engelhardtia mirabilis TaxID=2528011 RepID=A0A518BMI9_9BACT|nr:hypothetical protein Pla133_32570 [Planctomycetes bacterium Pla133]QDV02489.1 hypothetical protein Pla86_32560 [Planctomycetes bacterium Pla86]